MNSFRLKSYFTFLGRNKLYTAINLFGFAVSLSVVILLGLYIRGELSVDQFHKDKERIWRLESEDGSSFAAPIAGDIAGRYPEIETIVRVSPDEEFVVETAEEKVLTKKVMCADSAFFEIFSFTLLEGTPRQQLRTMQEVTLTRSFATRLFGEGPAMGQTFRIDTLTYVVTGVAADFADSHFQNPDMIMRFEHIGPWYLSGYDSCYGPIYLRTAAGSDLNAKMPDMLEFFKSYFWLYQKEYAKQLSLRPLTECHFDTRHAEWETFRVIDRGFLGVLAASMVLILVFALFNYINLSVAQSGFRAKEAATRRLLGSSPGGLVMDLIGESVIFCAMAATLGVVLASLAEPGFNKLLRADVNLTSAMDAGNLLWVCLGVVLLGVIAGILPALAISGHKPLEVVRGTLARKTKMVYSRILIVFQYCITIVLLGCTLTIMRQTHFMRTTDLGFDKENLIYIKYSTWPERQGVLRDRLMRIDGVQDVSFTRGTVMDDGNNFVMMADNGESTNFRILEVDTAFFRMMGLTEDTLFTAPSPRPVWINRTGWQWLEASGITDLFDRHGPVKHYGITEFTGIVNDFHVGNLRKKIPPMLISPSYDNSWNWEYLVKVSGRDLAETYRQVMEVQNEISGGMPVESGFVDRELAGWYDNQQQTYTIIGTFALIAIVIAALGMLAMATYSLRQRTAEIAIRKVFGSTDGEVLRRVVLGFMRMVLVAFILAVPVIWYAMEKWLAGYAYRISLGWTIFALAGGIAFAVAFAAVFSQSWKATRANPVDSLHK